MHNLARQLSTHWTPKLFVHILLMETHGQTDSCQSARQYYPHVVGEGLQDCKGRHRFKNNSILGAASKREARQDD